MLHKGAKTRFILDELSQIIDVCFSIRQGDPLSMILYILYIEPFLKYLEATLGSLRVPRVQHNVQLLDHTTVEAFCDDVNVLTCSLSDLYKVDSAVTKFEKISGALLSRCKKCVIMGFGGWKNKSKWPLEY